MLDNSDIRSLPNFGLFSLCLKVDDVTKPSSKTLVILVFNVPVEYNLGEMKRAAFLDVDGYCQLLEKCRGEHRPLKSESVGVDHWHKPMHFWKF